MAHYHTTATLTSLIDSGNDPALARLRVNRIEVIAAQAPIVLTRFPALPLSRFPAHRRPSHWRSTARWRPSSAIDCRASCTPYSSRASISVCTLSAICE